MTYLWPVRNHIRQTLNTNPLPYQVNDAGVERRVQVDNRVTVRQFGSEGWGSLPAWCRGEVYDIVMPVRTCLRTGVTHVINTEASFLLQTVPSVAFSYKTEELVQKYVVMKVQNYREGLKLNGLHQLLAYADDVNMLGENPQKIKENTGILLEDSTRTNFISNQSLPKNQTRLKSNECENQYDLIRGANSPTTAKNDQ
ncbi:hypothetical protein ANN_20862 [Periplaneta americana]|uniref:Reverse transcriptase domain-containing protein n=1 Tax=Periplaneta americana TaxID=6978 RepID=A0ABQ8SEY4_PERAM|nr:hypothetical protein ANN_20862 [Periplaneta americana]